MFLSCRIKELSDKEADVDKKMALRKTFRTLQGVSVRVYPLPRFVVPSFESRLKGLRQGTCLAFGR